MKSVSKLLQWLHQYYQDVFVINEIDELESIAQALTADSVICTRSKLDLPDGFYLIWQKGDLQLYRLRPLKISACLIIKNEEDNIEACLKSIEHICDEIIILDTGSTDRTKEILSENNIKYYESKKFDTETKTADFHFAEARNESLSYATGDWILWIDADDRWIGDRAALHPTFDAYDVIIRYGDSIYHSKRLIRNHNPRFAHAIHEYPILTGFRDGGLLENNSIIHIGLNKPGRVSRNLEILRKEYNRDSSNLRTIFYLANAYRENQEYERAIAYYRKYLKFGTWKDEIMIAFHYLMECQFKIQDYPSVLESGFQALVKSDQWSETHCWIGRAYLETGDFKRALRYFQIANEIPVPETNLFVDRRYYHTFPEYYITLCKHQLKQQRNVIEVCRYGALGDVLMTTPALRELRRLNPKSHIRYVTSQQAYPILRSNSDINEIAFKSGPSDQQILFEYPEKPLKKHLREYFADCAGVSLTSDAKNIIELNLLDEFKINYDRPVITFSAKTGWSRYKEWPLDRWIELVSRFPEYQFVQLGAPGEPSIDGAHNLCGKISIRQSFSMIKQSVLFVGLDGLFGHATNAFGTPAVILFGSTSPTGFGYPGNTNLASGDECQPCYREKGDQRPPCPYAHKCMVDYMTVERVENAIRNKLLETHLHPGISKIHRT